LCTCQLISSFFLTTATPHPPTPIRHLLVSVPRLEKYYTSALALHNSAAAATDIESSYTLYLRVLIVYAELIKVKTPLREAGAAAKTKCQTAVFDAMDKAEELKKTIRAAVEEDIQSKRDALVSPRATYFRLPSLCCVHAPSIRIPLSQAPVTERVVHPPHCRLSPHHWYVAPLPPVAAAATAAPCTAHHRPTKASQNCHLSHRSPAQQRRHPRRRWSHRLIFCDGWLL
jgi:hypothetical protein